MVKHFVQFESLLAVCPSILGTSGSSTDGKDTGLSLRAADISFVPGTGRYDDLDCAKNGGSSSCEDQTLE